MDHIAKNIYLDKSSYRFLPLSFIKKASNGAITYFQRNLSIFKSNEHLLLGNQTILALEPKVANSLTVTTLLANLLHRNPGRLCDQPDFIKKDSLAFLV